MAETGEGEALGTTEEEGGGVVLVSAVTGGGGDDDEGAVAMRHVLLKIGEKESRNENTHTLTNCLLGK